MTYDPHDIDVERFDSGVFGEDLNFHYSRPNHAAEASSGGGSVTYSKRGAKVQGGNTSGDIAEVSGLGVEARFKSIRRVIVLRVDSSCPYADDCEVGAVDASANQDAGAYWDMKDDVFHVGSTVSSALNINPQFNPAVLSIDMDYQDTETTFRVWENGQERASATLSEVPTFMRPNIARVESLGNGNSVTIQNCRTAFTKFEA